MAAYDLFVQMHHPEKIETQHHDYAYVETKPRYKDSRHEMSEKVEADEPLRKSIHQDCYNGTN
jgi:hypothetical protein